MRLPHRVGLPGNMMRFGALATLALLIVSVIGVGISLAVPSSSAGPSPSKASGGCPSSNAIGNFLPSHEVGASISNTSNSSSYFFDSRVDRSPSGGIPGLIQFCVYPSGSLPSSTTASATGADGSSFVSLVGAHQGYFAFGRSSGDPSNLPLDGKVHTAMGSAAWSAGLPSTQTVLLHINDGSECQALYGGSSSTCFVFPASQLCNGKAACKSVSIPEATSSGALSVPLDTQLHFHYTYTVVNQPGNSFNMSFTFTSTPGPNAVGFHDYFGGCNQTVDPNGSPGSVL